MRAGLRIGWFAAAALVTGVLASALQVERLAGDATAPSLVFDVEVPRDALEVVTAASIEQTWRERMREHDVQVTPGAPARDGHVGVRVTVVGAYPAKELIVASALTSSARLELAMVRSGDPAIARWYQAVNDHEIPSIAPTVEAKPDVWSVERTGAEQYDSYLWSASLDALDHAVALLRAAHPLPDGFEIRYERVEPYPGGEQREPMYRTYLVSEDDVLGNEHIAAAQIEHDPNTMVPEVRVVLTDEGARRFGDATAAGVGQKLAILLDGDVKSAPIIQSAIRGGEVSITMGGTDPQQQLSEASTLAGALGSRLPLPPGFAAKLVTANAPDAGLGWLLRLLAAALGGALGVALATLFERRRWFSLAPSVSAGAERWDALAIPALVTLLVPAIVWFIGSEIMLPAVNEVEMMNVVRDPSRSARSLLGIFALGLAPVTSAFVIVELYAILVEALVPARRGRRLGTPDDRRRIDRAAWVLVGILTLVQSYFFALYLEAFDLQGVEIYFGGKHTKWLVVLSLTAGVMVQIIAAEAISRRGLVNGFLALLAAASAADLFLLLAPDVDPRAMDPHRPSEAVFAAIALVAGAATVVSTRARTGTDGPRLPYTGVVPASLVRGGIGLVAFAAVWSPKLAERLADLQPWTPLLELASVVPLTALILLSTRRAWTTPGVVATLAYLAALVLLPFAVSEPYRLGVPLAEGVLLGVVGAELWVGVLARVRLPDAVSVLVVHDVDRADRVADRLAAAGIPHALLGVRARAALRFVGAWAPIAVRVPRARAEEAAALLAAPDTDAMRVPTPAPALAPPAS
ncbi:MAG TPA: hypothetical protein VM261_08575 [Kofleriaceae bacterium]|nr:hypothetical protein [Kofleriaceae bacterium]